MDFFQVLASLKPQHPLTKQQMEENEKFLLSHPLFAQKMPDDISQNQAFKAIVSLQQPEDPNQQALILNNQANNKMRQNPDGLLQMKQAYTKYTQGIKLKCTDPSTNAKLRANRAQINLKLRNYGKVIIDCKDCLRYDPNFIKAYFRCGKAFMALQKYEQCAKLLQNRKQPELVEIYTQAKSKHEKKNKEQALKKQKKQQIQNQIKSYCEKKNWKYLKRQQPLPQGVKAKITQNNTLCIPLVILYPQFGQFDLIASTSQTDKIKQHIKQPIQTGLPWDHKKQYVMDTVEIFCEVSEAVLMRIPKQAKITDILSRVPFRQALQVQIVRKDNNFYNNYISQHKII